MAVPKSKISKQRKNKRRASAYQLKKATVVECENCHEMKLPHRICPSCGHYDGKEVIAVD